PGTRVRVAALAGCARRRALPAPADPPRLHGARLPVRLGLRGGPAPLAALAAREPAPRAPPRVRPRRRLCAAPSLSLPVEDARGEPRREGHPVRVRCAPGDRGDAAPG